MSTIGRRPALACPAAKATACDSQMPVSKNRSGNAVAHRLELGSLAHGGGHHRDARVGGHLAMDRFAGHVGVGPRAGSS